MRRRNFNSELKESEELEPEFELTGSCFGTGTQKGPEFPVYSAEKQMAYSESAWPKTPEYRFLGKSVEVRGRIGSGDELVGTNIPDPAIQDRLQDED